MSNRSARGLLLICLVTGLLSGPVYLSVRAAPQGQAAASIVVSEFRTSGTDEYIELHNPTNATVDIGGWDIRRSTGCGSGTTFLLTIDPGTLMDPGEYFLITGSGYTGGTPGDISDSLSIADTGGIALLDSTDAIVDQVGMCSTTAYKEGDALATLGSGQSYERKPGGSAGSCVDANDNSADFANIGAGNPRNSSSAPVICVGVSNVTSTATDGTYTVGAIINVTIAFSGPVTVVGAPSLLLETGSMDRNATYTGGSGTSVLTFDYTVVSGDNSADLDYVAIDSLALNGGSITSMTGGTDAVLTLPSPGTVGSLGDNKNIVINNGVAPSILSFTRQNPPTSPTNADILTFRATFSETVNGVDATDFVVHTNSTPPTTTATVTGVSSVTGSIYDVTVSGGNLATFNGAVGIDLTATQDIQDIVSTALPNGEPPTDEVYTVDNSTPTATATPLSSPLAIVISEVAWMGTGASSSDEWIELYNPNSFAVNLNGWRLCSDNLCSDGQEPRIDLTGTISGFGFFLLERTDNQTVSDIAADQIYSGELVNSGDILYLNNPNGVRVDTANIDGGAWPAGSTTNNRTMERYRSTLPDSPFAWVTNTGVVRNGLDANGNPINGTPKNQNWAFTVTLTPTPRPATRTPTRAPTPSARFVINEFLPRAAFDWNQDGTVDVFDEFIEVANLGPVSGSLNGWILDDEEDAGSSPYSLSGISLDPGEHAFFFGLETNILLSDGGDTVRLLNPGGAIMDSHTYPVVKIADQTWCRLPDIRGSWYEDCFPTPGVTNTRSGRVPALPPGTGLEEPLCLLPDTLPQEFRIAECFGFGANMWSALYWDETGRQGDQPVPQENSQWEMFVE